MARPSTSYHRSRKLQGAFIKTLRDGGLPISPQYLSKIPITSGDFAEKEKGAPDWWDGRQHLWLLPEQAERARNRPNNPQVGAECYLDRIPAPWKVTWEGREITKDDWKPADVLKHTDEFREFIVSHIPRFDQIIPYDKFYIYIQQALNWLADPQTYASCKTKRERIEYGLKEWRRCQENRLYALQKYCWIREGAEHRGRRKWKASTPQALLLFMMDCGYSFYGGKGRQGAFTSTLAPALMFQAAVRFNQYIKIIAGDQDTVSSIFDQKIHFPYGEVANDHPWFLPPPNYGRKGNRLQFGSMPDDVSTRSQKITAAAKGSLIEVDAPNVAAVNSASPDAFVVDEAVKTPKFSGMIREVLPTLKGTAEDGSIIPLRQLIAISSGIPNSSGDFEADLRSLEAKFRKGQHDIIVPIFFDWTCRPGATWKDREEARMEAETGGAIYANIDNVEERRAAWRMHWPQDLEDMFAISHRTLVPLNDIRIQKDYMDACFAREKALRPVNGYFEPVYDLSEGAVMPEGSYFPRKVKDSIFVPLGDDDFDAPATMWLPREPGWLDRWWQGTDPLIADHGTSKQASIILDCREPDEKATTFPTIACMVNYREGDINKSYEQTALMGLYYGTGTFVPELIEANLGKGYVMFKEQPALMGGNSFIYNRELPADLQVPSRNFPGMDTKELRKLRLIGYGKQFLQSHLKNIFLPAYLHQLRYFALRVTPEGNERWGPSDKTINDDALIASFLAWVARMSFPERKARRIDLENPEYVYEDEYYHDANMELRTRKVRRPLIHRAA